MSNKLYQRVVKQILSKACPTDLFSDVEIGDCPMSFQKQKSFVLKTVFFIYDKCNCEGVNEDTRDGAWHVNIHVEMCMFYLNVCVCVCV